MTELKLTINLELPADAGDSEVGWQLFLGYTKQRQRQNIQVCKVCAKEKEKCKVRKRKEIRLHFGFQVVQLHTVGF